MSAGWGSPAPRRTGMDLTVAAARPGAGPFDRRVNDGWKGAVVPYPLATSLARDMALGGSRPGRLQQQVTVTGQTGGGTLCT
jgi:hypothetical protein